MVPTLAQKKLVSKRPPLGKYPMRNRLKVERDSKRDEDVSETLIEVTLLQVRQAFDAAVDLPNLREQVEEEHQQAREMQKANAAELAELNTITMMATIEIAQTDTGRSKCIAC